MQCFYWVLISKTTDNIHITQCQLYLSCTLVYSKVLILLISELILKLLVTEK